MSNYLSAIVLFGCLIAITLAQTQRPENDGPRNQQQQQQQTIGLRDQLSQLPEQGRRMFSNLYSGLRSRFNRTTNGAPQMNGRNINDGQLNRGGSGSEQSQVNEIQDRQPVVEPRRQADIMDGKQNDRQPMNQMRTIPQRARNMFENFYSSFRNHISRDSAQTNRPTSNQDNSQTIDRFNQRIQPFNRRPPPMNGGDQNEQSMDQLNRNPLRQQGSRLFNNLENRFSSQNNNQFGNNQDAESQTSGFQRPQFNPGQQDQWLATN